MEADKTRPQPCEDRFHVSVTVKVDKYAKGGHSHIRVRTSHSSGTQSEAVKEAVEAALAELKGKP